MWEIEFFQKCGYCTLVATTLENGLQETKVVYLTGKKRFCEKPYHMHIIRHLLADGRGI